MNKKQTESKFINCSVDKENRQLFFDTVKASNVIKEATQVFPNDQDAEMETWFIVECNDSAGVDSVLEWLPNQKGVTKCERQAVRKLIW